jgi:hypothetical protein
MKEIVDIDYTLTCVCGHTREFHWLTGDGCNTCFYMYQSQDKWQHRFQLDNLSYIEKLARERGLV